MDRRGQVLHRRAAGAAGAWRAAGPQVDDDAADPERAAWRMQATKSYDDDGNAVYRIVMPAQKAAVLDAGLEAMQAQLDRQRLRDASAEAGAPQPDGGLDREAPADASAEASSPQPATLAEALVAMAQTVLQAQPPAAARTSRAVLTAQVDPLTGWPPAPRRRAAAPQLAGSDTTLPPDHVTGRIDLDYAVMVLSQQSA